MDSRAGAGAATTAANDAGAGAAAATGENFGVTTVDDAAAPSFRPPRACGWLALRFRGKHVR